MVKMQLYTLPIGKHATIEKIESEKLALQLAQMGLVNQVPICVLHKNSKTIIIETNKTRIILGSGIASSIEVSS